MLLSFPGWARTESVEFSIAQPVTVSGKTLDPGDYTINVKNGADQMDITKDGQVVLQAPCHWIQLKTKPDNTEVEFTANKMTEIEFGGKTDAVQVP